jgi:hypothetical protein
MKRTEDLKIHIGNKYALLVVNYRAVAQAHYFWSAVSDFIIASFRFFVIKKDCYI